MKANCKRGDVAMYVGSHKSASGVIVLCEREITLAEMTQKKNALLDLPAWKVNPPIRRDDGSYADFASDHALRPIRSQDGADEMLAIAGLPAEVKR